MSQLRFGKPKEGPLPPAKMFFFLTPLPSVKTDLKSNLASVFGRNTSMSHPSIVKLQFTPRSCRQRHILCQLFRGH